MIGYFRIAVKALISLVIIVVITITFYEYEFFIDLLLKILQMVMCQSL
jgi:hypothetical protein